MREAEEDVLKVLEAKAKYVQCLKCKEIVKNTALAKSNHFLTRHHDMPYSTWETIEWIHLISEKDVVAVVEPLQNRIRELEIDHVDWLKAIEAQMEHDKKQLEELREAILSFNKWIIETDGRGISSEVHDEFNERFKKFESVLKGEKP